MLNNRSLMSLFSFIEKSAAYAQGKGWGAATVRREVQIASRFLRPEPHLFIDIGGNVGAYSTEMRKRYPEVEIHIFEPASKNVEILRDVFRSDQCTRINQSAASNVNGEAALYADFDGSGLASLTKRRMEHFSICFEQKQDVSTIRIEDYWRSNLNNRQIDFAKIDIEGHEMSALEGFGRALAHVSLIQFEFGGANIDTRTYFQDYYYFFRDNKFSLYRLTPIGPSEIKSYKEIDEAFRTTNFLARSEGSRSL